MIALQLRTEKPTDLSAIASLTAKVTQLSRNKTLPDGPTDFATIKSAPAHHARTTGHSIAWHVRNIDLTLLNMWTNEPANIKFKFNHTDGARLCR